MGNYIPRKEEVNLELCSKHLALATKPAILIGFMTLLSIIQVALAIFLIIGILLQNSTAGLGSALGGGTDDDFAQHTRRGAERALFYGTILLAVLFVFVSYTIVYLS